MNEGGGGVGCDSFSTEMHRMGIFTVLRLDANMEPD